MPPHDIGDRLGRRSHGDHDCDGGELQNSQNRIHHKTILICRGAKPDLSERAPIKPHAGGFNPQKPGSQPTIDEFGGAVRIAGTRWRLQKRIEPFFPAADTIIRG
jgi:hypothetical protein